MPKIIFMPTLDYGGGGYYHPGQYEIEREGRFIDGKRGIIEVAVDAPELIEATIFHEWRHHWQFFQFGNPPDWPWQIIDDDYEESIRQYFKAPHELDALRFEHRYARNDLNDSWIGLLKNDRYSINRPS